MILWWHCIRWRLSHTHLHTHTYTHTHTPTNPHCALRQLHNHHSNNRPVLTSSKLETTELEVRILVFTAVAFCGWDEMRPTFIVSKIKALQCFQNQAKANQGRGRNHTIQPTSWYTSILPVLWWMDGKWSGYVWWIYISASQTWCAPALRFPTGWCPRLCTKHNHTCGCGWHLFYQRPGCTGW